MSGGESAVRFSPQRHGSRLILRKVKEVRVPLLLKVKLLWLRSPRGVWAEGCGSQDGTTSNLRGVILGGKRTAREANRGRAIGQRRRFPLTRGSTGVCSLPSSLEDCDQATPQQPGNRQDGGNPSQSEMDTHSHGNTLVASTKVWVSLFGMSRSLRERLLTGAPRLSDRIVSSKAEWVSMWGGIPGKGKVIGWRCCW